MFKYLLLCAILFTLIASTVAYGQECYSYLTISLVSTETTSLEGFSIKLDGKNIGKTDEEGHLSIALAGIPLGRHNIQAVKQEDDARFGGSQPIDIPCVDASIETEYYVTLDVFFAQPSPWKLKKN